MNIFDMHDLFKLFRYCIIGIIIWEVFGFVVAIVVSDSSGIHTANFGGYLKAFALSNVLAGLILGGLIYLAMIISGFAGGGCLSILLPLLVGALFGYVESSWILPDLAQQFGFSLRSSVLRSTVGIINGILSVPLVIKLSLTRTHSVY